LIHVLSKPAERPRSDLFRISKALATNFVAASLSTATFVVTGMMLSLVLLALYFSAVSNAAINFAYEAVQLTPEFIKANQALEFQDISSARSAADDSSAPRCRYQPGDEGWPTEEEWAAFNTSLGGKLLKPVPPGAACYRGPYFNQTQCDFLVGPAKDTRFYLDDPLTALTSWTEGSTCLAVANATGNCTQGGFPVFVVNATTVRDIQMAVNFARNKNLRLNIKYVRCEPMSFMLLP